MLNIVRKSGKILKNNLIFIQPLLLFFLLIMTTASFFINKNILFAGKICLTISILLLIVAFTSGWFNINKYGVISYEENDTQEEIANKAIAGIKTFFEGVGRNFFKTLGAYLFIGVFFIAVIYCVSNLLVHTLGEPKLMYEIPKLAQASSQAEVLNFVKNISDNDKIIFSIWMIVANVVLLILDFFALLYFSVINFENENIIKSVWTTIKFFFKNFINSIGMIFFIFALYLGLNFASLLLGANSFSLVILIILFTVYLNYSVLLVFCFYNEKTKINSDSRTELIG